MCRKSCFIHLPSLYFFYSTLNKFDSFVIFVRTLFFFSSITLNGASGSGQFLFT